MVTGTPYTPPVTVATFRRSAIAAAVLAVVTLVVTVVMGYGLFGVFMVVGLALGVANSLLVVRAVANFAATPADQGAVLPVGVRPHRRDDGHRARLRTAVPARGDRCRRGSGPLPVRRGRQLDGAADQGDPTEMTDPV